MWSRTNLVKANSILETLNWRTGFSYFWFVNFSFDKGLKICKFDFKKDENFQSDRFILLFKHHQSSQRTKPMKTMKERLQIFSLIKFKIVIILYQTKGNSKIKFKTEDKRKCKNYCYRKCSFFFTLLLSQMPTNRLGT